MKKLIIHDFIFGSCRKEGCNPLATNYDSNAKKDDNSCEYCTSDQVLDDTRGECNQTLNFNSLYNENIQGNNRVINANSIPNHDVGLFGPVKFKP